MAVFDFESKDENVRGLGPKVATLVNANLSAESSLIMVERAELEQALGDAQDRTTNLAEEVQALSQNKQTLETQLQERQQQIVQSQAACEQLASDLRNQQQAYEADVF